MILGNLLPVTLTLVPTHFLLLTSAKIVLHGSTFSLLSRKISPSLKIAANLKYQTDSGQSRKDFLLRQFDHHGRMCLLRVLKG